MKRTFELHPNETLLGVMKNICDLRGEFISLSEEKDLGSNTIKPFFCVMMMHLFLSKSVTF